MNIRTVRVGAQEIVVEVSQLQASFWRASGAVKKQRVQATGQTEAQALWKWQRAAEAVLAYSLKS